MANLIPNERAPWQNFMLLIGFILIGLSLGNLLAISTISALGNYLGDFSFDQFEQLLRTPQKFIHGWWYLVLTQMLTHTFTFLVPSLVYWRFVEKHSLVGILQRAKPKPVIFLFTFIVVVAFVPFNSWIIQLNNSMKLPVGFEQLEAWMKSKEMQLNDLTVYLTSFTSFWELSVAFFVIAIIASLGEEILFRGIIQRKIFSKTQSVHVSVWLAAILFSAIHLQFYGFFPRMILGALFGYLYVWTANLWVPVFAHTINNGLNVLVVFLYNRKFLSQNIDEIEQSIPVLGVLASLVITIFALRQIKKAERTY